MVLTNSMPAQINYFTRCLLLTGSVLLVGCGTKVEISQGPSTTDEITAAEEQQAAAEAAELAEARRVQGDTKKKR